MRIQMPNSPRGSKMRNPMMSRPYNSDSTWNTFGNSVGDELTAGSSDGSSWTRRGSSVMNSAPMMEPEIVATPPISTMAMNCTDSSRLNEPGSKNPVTVYSSAP